MEKTLSEEELLQGIKDGSEEAYKKLFFNYFEGLTFFANKYLRDMDAAQDVVQEVFSYLYEQRDTLLISTSLKSFLYKSVTNKSLNILKHEGVKQRNHAHIKETSSEGFEEDALETAELEAKINQLIDELPTECARIFRMSRMDQKSNQEIADELNISKRTVETQISKALKTLRSALKIIIIEIILKNFS
jgi:RNA polymerase sigma-70 factor (family 1)